MTHAARQILEQALTLPADEREALISALCHSLQPVELTPQWRAEAAHRVGRIEAGDAVLHDAEAHLRALRAKYDV